MISNEGRDEIAEAVEQRKLMLERQLSTAPYERRAQIAEDIEACRSLLKELEQSPCGPPTGTTIN
jgi:hypothetical protein